ncbi:unnamed protein product [Pylaiella littoralis]
MDKRSEDSSRAGKGTQGRRISSQGGRRGHGPKRKDIDISSLRTLIGEFPRAFKKTDGTVATPKGKSKFYLYKIGNAEETLGLNQYDTNGEERTLSYPSDATGNEIEQTVGIKNRLSNARLVSDAKNEVHRLRENKAGAKR